jgi:hypothetical protein
MSIRRIAVAFGLSLVAASAFAGKADAIHITSVTADQGVFFVYVDQPATGVPACATTTQAARRFAIDESTTTGKVQIAVAMSAQARGAVVYVVGTNACSIWPDAETLQYLTAG